MITLYCWQHYQSSHFSIWSYVRVPKKRKGLEIRLRICAHDLKFIYGGFNAFTNHAPGGLNRLNNEVAVKMLW